MRKYINIVCDVLCDKNKLFTKYINISLGECLHKIITHFHDFVTCIPNIYGAIDGTPIPLIDLPDKRMTLVASDFCNRIFFNSIVMQVVCDVDMRY